MGCEVHLNETSVFLKEIALDMLKSTKYQIKV